MTQPTSTPEDNKARAFFAACLFIGAGFAGLAVAGLVLGADYMLHGEPHERERLAEQRAQRNRDRHADALAWLENDRLERERHRKATRDWFTADPETRGEKPSSGESFGRAMGRAWNNLLVGAGRFKRGWQKGRVEAQARRDAGEAGWWRTKRFCPQCRQRPQRDQGLLCTDCRDGLLADLDTKYSGGPQDPPMPPRTPDPAPEPNVQQPTDTGPDIVDAEIVPDPAPSTREVVPVGEDDPRRPDESLDEYQRRLDDLEGEVRQNQNGHRPEPSQSTLR